jgi:hypothetical protein
MACNAPDLSEQDSVPVGHPPGVHGVESKIQFKKKGKRKSCHFYGVSIFRVPFMIFFYLFIWVSGSACAHPANLVDI